MKTGRPPLSEESLDFDLGFFDEDCGRVEPAVNPFLPAKV
jgi:hypothetical protein